MIDLNNPLVSVFVPYYNDQKFLFECINSVINQTYKNIEIILLNHASTDDSEKIAKSFDDSRIKHIKMDKNLGAGCGILMLESLKLAKGKYIKLFCADDIMKPKCVEVLVDYLENNPQKDIVFADEDYINIDGKLLDIKWSQAREKFNFKNNELETLKLLFYGIGHIPYISSLVKRETLSTAQIDTSFVMLIDMKLWASLLINNAKIAFIENSLVYYRIHKTKQQAVIKSRKSLKEVFMSQWRILNCFMR